MLREQFRQLAKHIGCRLPLPAPRPGRRRSGEGARDFAPAKVQLTRRTPVRSLLEAGLCFWDTMTWLQLWERNDTYETVEEINAEASTRHLSLDL
jgi:hypothetical protein